MSHKRRLTGYMEETEDKGKTGLSEWREKEKGKRGNRRKVRSLEDASNKGKRRRDVEAPSEIESELEDNSVVVAHSRVGVKEKHAAPILKKEGKKKNRDEESGNEVMDKFKDRVTFFNKECDGNEITKKDICEATQRLCHGIKIPQGIPTGKGRFVVPIPKGRHAGANLVQEAILQATFSYSSLQCDMDKVCPGVDRPNVAPRITTPAERKLFQLCKCGDVLAIQQYLQCSKTKVNINAKNYQGETALRIAVQYGHEALVAFLTSLSNINMADILMFAIYCKQPSIVKYLSEKYDLDRKVCSLKENDFPVYVSPLSLAAEVGCYEIVDYLINVRCHDLIIEPHHIRCRCRLVCHPFKKKDPLEVAYRTLHIYRALSQPVYYIHATDDPFTRSFRLHNRLMDMSEFFLPLKSRFVCLAERCQCFASELIAECRNSDEVKTVLSRETGIRRWWDRLSKTDKMQTLFMAVDYKQKCFVAQPAVQVVVEELWMGEFYSWKVMKAPVKVVQAIIKLIMVPVTYFAVIARPRASSTTSLTLPVNKFLTSAGCYLVFLCLLFYLNVRPKARYRCPMSMKDIEIYITIFVLGYTAQAVRQAIAMHPRRYFAYQWSWYDLCILLAFWFATAFWISAQFHYYMIDYDIQKMERKNWASLDPILMADGFFVIGSVLAYLKLFFYFQISRNVGPMQIAVDAMLKEFIKYSVFWLIIIGGFTVALAKFYSYYVGMKYIDPDTGNVLKQENSFVSFTSTFKTLFFGMFGKSSVSNADVIIENLKTCKGDFLNEHNFTEFIGYLCFGMYMIMMTFVVINMIIATMVGAFSKVLIALDSETKFNETYIYLYYLCHSVLAPPFNLLPHLYSLASAGMLKKKPRHKCLPPLPPPPPYCELIKKLVLRYFHTKAERKKTAKICFTPERIKCGNN